MALSEPSQTLLIILDNLAQCPPAWYVYSDNLEGEEIVMLFRAGYIRVDWINHKAQITEAGYAYWQWLKA